MKNINLNEKEVIILRSLLDAEIEYLENSIKEETDNDDKNELSKELESCKNILTKLN